MNLNFQVGTKKSAAAEKGKAKQKTIKAEVMPSPHGTRIAPKIPEELRKKAAQAIAAKDRKEGKVMLNILTRWTECLQINIVGQSNSLSRNIFLQNGLP